MRLLTLGSIGIAFILSGCCADHESPTSAQSAKACGDGACCAMPSRSALLAREEEAAAIALKTVTFDAFKKDIKFHNGKVVCAYLWTSTSGPSKKNLPTLLALQHKFAKDGLVCVTVSNDDAKTCKEALACLEKEKCDLVNYLQDEKDASDGWTNCFGCCGFPVLIVFGRDGKASASFEVTELPFEPATIEKTLVKLLERK